MPRYALIALVIFLLSLMGSPIGAIGQSIMLGMFPAKRERYLSFMTFFGAVGSLLAPVIVSSTSRPACPGDGHFGKCRSLPSSCSAFSSPRESPVLPRVARARAS